MDTSKVLSLLELLDDEVDDLEEALGPLLNTVLSETSSKLPLLDKAKLYVLITYAIESVLFSYLRLNGVKAREHPVFKELTRVKQYFEKVKLAENPIAVEKRQNLSLDKEAAARIIKAGLTGNDKWDLEKLEQQAKERAKAHIKFNELSGKAEQNDTLRKRTMADIDPAESESESGSELSEETTIINSSKVSKKRQKLQSASAPSSGLSSALEKTKSKKKPDGKEKPKEKKPKKSKKNKKPKIDSI